MPRGQDAPTQGYTIDPYVAKSISESKAQASNRLIAAMQEQGAMQRQKSSQQSALIQQGMRQQSEMQQQAAQIEAQDRRAAENIAARREENALAKALEESRQRFEAGENTKRLDFERERDKGNLEIAKQYHLEEMANKRADRDLALARAAMEDNRMLSIANSTQNKETAMQESITAVTQAAEEGKQLTDLYNKTLARQTSAAMTDFKNLPIEEKAAPPPRIVTTIGGPALAAEPQTQFTADNYTGPGKILQRLITDNGSGVSIGDLTSATINNFQDQIRTGKLDAEDIRGAITALDAALPAIDKRIEETSGRAQTLWKAFRSRAESMQDNLESLRNKKDKIEGQQHETVGSLVRRALGVKYPEMSFSTRMLDLQNKVGQINEKAIREMMKGIEPWEKGLLPIDPTTMNKYDIAIREAHNAGLTNARQTYGGGGASPTWGAD